MITATLINVAAVIIGGVIGLIFKGKIPQKFADSVTGALGLCVIIIGVNGSLSGDVMLLVCSIALGAFTGELLNIDGKLNRLGEKLQKKFSKSEDSSFSEGFVAATLLFCVGAMSVVGSINSGLSGDMELIETKSVLDGVSAAVFASTLGVGVLFSAIAVFLYQGFIEFFAGQLESVLTDSLITQISAAGSIMILVIGLNMVVGTKIKAANLLPGLVFATAYYYIFL